MASAQYLVEVDFDRDSGYGNALSDISQYVKALRWNNGMTRPDMEVANPATLSITLDNSFGDFNPEESGASYYGLFKRGQLIRVRAVFSSTTYTLFIGKLKTIPRLDPRNYGTQEVSLSAADLMDELLDAEFTPDLLTNVTTDAALQHVFDKSVVALPYASDYWILGNATNSLLGSTTRLVDTAAGVNFETGKTTLAYVGDNTGGDRSTRAQQYIRDVVAAEGGGRFWFDGRTGKFTFHHRQHDVNPTIAVTLTGDDYEDATYVHQTEVINRVTAHYTPREVGAAQSVIWAHEGTIELANGQQKSLTARYRDPDDNSARVGAMNAVPPVRGADFIANSASDGSGNDLTDKVALSVDFGAGQAKVFVSNNSGTTAHVTTLQLRGTPLKSYQKQSVTVDDGESFRLYDINEDQITLTMVDNQELAEKIAQKRMGQYKDPTSILEKVTFIANKDDTRMTQCLTRAIGDAITIQHSGMSHDKDYVIVGEQHRITAGGDHTHEVTWILYPNERQQYWVLGDAALSLLGSTTTLAF